MKKVRYLLGAAGLVPTAVALAAPGTATATATHPPQAPATTRAAKVVSGQHLHATPAAGCTGTINAHANADQISETFWYTKSGCLGTVKETVTFYGNFQSGTMHVRVYHNNTLESIKSEFVSAYVGSRYWDFGFHKKFPTPIKVCAGATNFSGYPCKTVD